MKKNWIIVMLSLFCGLLLLYAFQQKAEADAAKDMAITLQVEAERCQEEFALQLKIVEELKSIAESANIEALEQNKIAEKIMEDRLNNKK